MRIGFLPRIPQRMWRQGIISLMPTMQTSIEM
jgi:hypothetical protein